MVSEKELNLFSNTAEEIPRQSSYERYLELGGLINEGDYLKAMCRMEQTTTLEKCLIYQAEYIARTTGIRLQNVKGELDPTTILYGVLRTDQNPDAKYHYGQMCDQQLFAEALRMLDQPESLARLIQAYPNTRFE